jgi:hypothetical protein
MTHWADDFAAIAQARAKIRTEEHGANALPPLPLSFNTDLDAWATLYDLTRSYGENDATLRGRIQERID